MEDMCTHGVCLLQYLLKSYSREAEFLIFSELFVFDNLNNKVKIDNRRHTLIDSWRGAAAVLRHTHLSCGSTQLRECLVSEGFLRRRSKCTLCCTRAPFPCTFQHGSLKTRVLPLQRNKERREALGL